MNSEAIANVRNLMNSVNGMSIFTNVCPWCETVTKHF